MKKWLIRLSRIELVLIFLVIIAGSVVRMSGSGMGCPDWPKCFGHLIPPTERSQLEWHPNTAYHRKQIIIVDEALYFASQDFTSGANYDASNWEAYTRHDYAIFNPVHTWIEYINRLIGALSGLPMLALFFISIFLVRENWSYLLLSAAGLFMLGFEAWLGKLVVDGNLIPGSITIHMIGALMIVAILLVLNGLAERGEPQALFSTLKFKYLGLLAIILSLVQIGLGTQVREVVDTLQQSGMPRDQWMENMDLSFYIHRSFSILILLLNLWLWRQNKNEGLGFWQWNYILIVLGLEIAAGIILAYFDLPYFAQPLHLLLGSILFALQGHALIQLILNAEARPLIKA